jgi:two-component system, OmpR family, response regulator
MTHGRIVVIDDDDGIREVLSLSLAGEGYEVETARGGSEGLELLARHPADVVIADVKMADMDGMAFCRAYAEFGAGAGPVILISAMPANNIDREVPGVIEFVTKPFDIERLFGVIAGAVAKA